MAPRDVFIAINISNGHTDTKLHEKSIQRRVIDPFRFDFRLGSKITKRSREID